LNLLIKRARVVQFYPPKIIDDCDVFIVDEVIKAVGKDCFDVQKGIKVDQIIDATGKIVIPGNVCSHNHFYSTLARGILVDVKPSYDFVGILENLWWRLDKALDESSLYYSGLVGTIEAITKGTTAVIDHNASPSYIRGSLKILKKAFDKFGLRGILGYEVTDRNGLPDRDLGIEENVDFIKHHETEMLKGTIGAHAPFTLSDKSLEYLSKAVRETERGIHIHVSEDRYELSYSHHFHNSSPLERLERFELLNGRSLIIHGVHLIEKDIDILNKYDAFLIHNPKSNMNNCVGYNSKLKQVKNCAIGTDGIGSDMFEETKFGFFKSRDEGLKIPSSEFMRYLSQGNIILERYFGKRFGRIEPGCIADLVILDYLNPTPMKEQNLDGHFMFGLSSQAVETVIINGICVYFNRKFPFDIEPIYQEALKESRNLWDKMNIL
jgi:putative selenium metabolism protein SsnA